MKCEDCGGPTWDNREDKKNPNSPDYKCKDKDCGWAKWLTEKGDPSRKGKGKASKGGDKSDREQYWADKAVVDRVEVRVLRRQSAQGKALAFLGLAKYDKLPAIDSLKPIIDWFEMDATKAGANADKPATVEGVLPPLTKEEQEEALQAEESLEI